MKGKSYKLSLVAILVMVAGLASATERWTGAAGTTDWTTAGNWDGNAVPDGTENVYVSANGVNGTAVLSTTSSGGTFGVGWYANGTSTLTIATGGSFSNTGTSTLGRYANALGTLNVDVGSFTSGNSSGDSLIVGQEGSGVLNISNGGTISAGKLYAGYSSGGAGTITVDGSGSMLTTSGSTFVLGRSSSSGTLSITAGGQVSSAGTAYLGNVSSSTGSATVDGTGSLWDAATLLVGKEGQGTLTILDGGLVSAESLSIDVVTNGPEGLIQIGIDGMLAVADGGTTATSLGDFLALIGGSTDNIDYWNGTAWDDIANGTLGTDYTLTEYDEGSTSFTKLTVIPEPATLGLVCLLAGGMIFVRRRFLV